MHPECRYLLCEPQQLMWQRWRDGVHYSAAWLNEVRGGGKAEGLGVGWWLPPAAKGDWRARLPCPITNQPATSDDNLLIPPLQNHLAA